MNWKTWFSNLFGKGVTIRGHNVQEVPWGFGFCPGCFSDRTARNVLSGKYAKCRICNREIHHNHCDVNIPFLPFGNPENSKIMTRINSGYYDGTSGSINISGKNWLNNYVSSNPHSPYPVVYYHGVQIPHSSLTITKTGK